MKKHLFPPLFALLLLAVACAIPGSGEPGVSPSPQSGPEYTLEWLAGLAPETILIQLDYESTYFQIEAGYPFGRIPPFTLYADGTLIFLDPGESFEQRQLMAARLSPEEALSLVRDVMDAGFEGLEDYVDDCMPQDDGTELCVADASFTTLRATLASGELREVRSYFTFSNDPAALDEILRILNGYSPSEAKVYRPEQAALFIRRVSETLDVALSPWPLDPALLQLGGDELRAIVLEGDNLSRLIDVVGRSTGYFYFDNEGEAFAVYLVPWPLYADFSAELTAAFPPPPEPEPVFELAENAKANLAGLLGIPADEIQVLSMEEVEWPNGCLGIDYLDMACTEAIVPGFRLILSAGGQTYEYRSNLDGSLLLLADPAAAPPGDPPDGI